ncbi:hypothetical protein [Pseudoduganella namucuonensis]|uniref:Uncharacterized protein n=1 Tax=Pseudoduganella namucuonensis TaxID=1035707 RepID=A0A1I7GVX1_9BURK|nr:hypothetical protein [Pseudoduganella namucuonensis]SFU52555.1 hypothetical protein SAMN05216552_1004149 [Pseudoduganella namucuonensis]
MEPEHLIEVRTLDEHLSSDHSFGSALARTVGAIAAADGAPTLAQFAAVTDIAGDGKASAVFTALVLNAIESGVGVDWALNALARSAAGADHAARENAFTMLRPLIALQGAKARPLAQKVTKALGLRMRVDALDELPLDEERKLLSNLGDQARKLVKGRGLADAVADFGRSTGHAELLDGARRYQGGKLDQGQLRELVRQVTTAIEHGIAAYQERAATLAVAEAGAASMLASAQELQRQVQQRLALVDARIAYERSALWQDIDDAVHDAGNAIELAITDRLNTDEWKDEDVWASIGRNQFGQEMERRLDRVVRRKEEALTLLNHDLRLFQADMRLSQASVFQREHHAALARLMPRLRVGTRLVNKVDTAANLTLMSSAVAAAGTGTAAYLFGVAVVMPVIAPVAPFVGGAVLLAGAFKWLTDGGKRKRSEIRDKRRAFEDELRKRLKEAELSFTSQLEQVALGFHESARQMLTPVLLEAEAAGRVQGMRQRIADKVITQSQSAVRQLEQHLARAE